MHKYLLIPLLLFAACRATGDPFTRQETGNDGAIYVYRVFHFAGVAAPAGVWIDGRGFVDLDIDGYAVKVVPPGMHAVHIGGSYEISTKFEVKPGKMCFVRIEGIGIRGNCTDEVPQEIRTAKNQTPRH